ncbi:hypothetical protein [Paracidovorax konjaci]|uniref:PemK-like, MazF-like toxin of type II toxin-antitoxin system n=1 Tax=Paracidovorax konjaci TaxID=32040 RepID=A0A1I1WHA1_9BURK|nr:hypothetical protein [Paracidovorax konjaci]SFD92793.1 hypothetical protein SAMN04489710_10940 [Paracidovorax konjaci]
MAAPSKDGRIQPGCTLLIPSGPNGKSHLFVVVMDSRVINGQEHLLLASFSTVKKDLPHDKTCLVKANEHPFVHVESFVSYSQLRSETVEHVLARLDDGVFTVKSAISTTLLARIKAGLTAGRVPRYIKDDWGV